jgi:arginyl-tRNA synthetase
VIINEIRRFIESALEKCREDGIIPKDASPEIEITVPRQEAHGNFATNVALAVAKAAGIAPRTVAQEIARRFPKEAASFLKLDVAGPGFINFTVEPTWFLNGLKGIHEAGERFGECSQGEGRKVQVEFVSANPTGPLHIGHGRGAVYGDTLANVLSWAGFDVTKEYYVNDAGNQIRTLGKSIYLRMRELEGQPVDFPDDCYKGHYIVDIARKLSATCADELKGASEDEAIDVLGARAGAFILESIKQDLADTGVVHDTYFFETKLHTDNLVETTIAWLRKQGHVYDQDGAIWFQSMKFGDDKDRVLRKSDGSLTYFAADIAYHKEKYDRGFDRIIDIWGADHGGYVARMKAAVGAIGRDPHSFEAVLIQLVNLVRGGQTVSMSTRQATYETLEDVRNEVGRDACRYFFLMRSHNAQLDFDLDLARKETADNPVYYIQYAHARIASIFRKAVERGIDPATPDTVDITKLNLPEEARLARFAAALPDVVGECAKALEPHKLAFYLLEIARMFQSYYSKGRTDERYRVLAEDDETAAAKLYLLKNVQIVLQNALRILGISAPQKMAREEDIDA